MEVDDRVIVEGKQIFCKENQIGTIIATFTSTVKVKLDNGSKWFISSEYVKPYIENM